jgi:hypothetical protein
VGSPAPISEPIPGWITHYGDSFNGGTLGCGYGVYTSEDPTIIAVSPARYEQLPCGTLIEMCGPGGCLVGMRKDSCPGCIDNGFDLSEAAIARVCGQGSDVCKANVNAIGICGPADFALPKPVPTEPPLEFRTSMDALERSMSIEQAGFAPQTRTMMTAPAEPPTPACQASS